MSITTTGDSPDGTDARPATSGHLQERLAEAACYAVLRRVAPALRHDVAGVMQPVGMLMMVLQRRVQMPEPDMQAIASNVTSVSALTKEATTGCMNAMGWMALREKTSVGLRSGVDEAIKLLAVELSGRGLRLVNDLPDGGAEIPESYLRSVLMGALLAFCDQATVGGTLQVGFEAGSENGSAPSRLMLRRLPGSVASSPAPADPVRKSRNIDWQDVEAMAGSFGVSVARGDGWMALDLPKAS
jgi:hypothetical protein